MNEKAPHRMRPGSGPLRSRIAVWRVLAAGLAVLLVTGLLGVPPARASSAASAASAAQDVTGRITSGIAGKCLDNTGARQVNGNKAEIWACNGNAGSQLWTAEADGTIRIKDMCLDVRRNGTANGTKVDLQACNNGSNQQWRVSGSTLVGKQAGKCLDDPHSSAKNGTQLYMTLAARLYVATGRKNQGYLADAKRDWAWFQNVGNADHLAGSPTTMINTIPGLGALIYPDVFAGSNGKCQVKTGTVFFTLRLGQFVDALTSLYQATGNQSYLSQAKAVANCVTSAGCGGDRSHASPPLLDAQGILTEPCTGSPDSCRVTGNPDYLQYKGVFMRDLSCLPQVAQDPAYSAFIQAQASAVYADDQNPETAQPATQHLNRFGFTWDHWSAAGVNWASQGTALDALNAAIGGSALMC